jgi:VCBS repeat-containing protein
MNLGTALDQIVTPTALVVIDSQDTSAQGAAVTVNRDGRFTYDPTVAAALQALNDDDPVVTDTFQYTLTDQIDPDYSAIYDDGPLGFWQFNEGSGTAPQDSSGNGNDGVFVGSPSYTADGGGRTGLPGDFALDFTPGNRVDITTAATAFDSIVTQDEVTVEFWGFGDPAAQPRTNTTFNLGNGSNHRVAFSHVTWSDRRIYWDSGMACCGAGTRLTTNPLPEADFEGRWNHYALVKNGSTNFSGIYVNGNLVASHTNSTDAFGDPDFLKIAENFDGMLDDVAIYDKALDATRILAHFHSGSLSATSSATVSVQVAGVNDAPNAAADANTIMELVDDTVTNNAVTGNLLTNDSDVDDPTAALSVTQVSHATTGSDTSGTIAGDYGTLTWTTNTQGDGTYSYELDDAHVAVQALLPGQTLTDTFTYTINDNHSGDPKIGATNLVITIQGANDSPWSLPSKVPTIHRWPPTTRRRCSKTRSRPIRAT